MAAAVGEFAGEQGLRMKEIKLKKKKVKGC